MAATPSPDLHDVFGIFKHGYASQWDDIGGALKVDADCRSGLRAQGLMTSDKHKLESILQKWLESHCSPPTWDNLISALKKEQLGTAAGKVEQYLTNDEDAIRKYKWKASASSRIQQSDQGANGVETQHSTTGNKIKTAVPDPPAVPDEDCLHKRKIKTAEVPFSADLVKDVFVLLMTVTDDEYGAVVAKTKPLEGQERISVVNESGVRFLIGNFGLYKVAIMKTQSGGDDISDHLPALLQLLTAAKYIVSVGMCYGMNPTKVKLGDVVVANEIVDFSKSHMAGQRVEFEPRQYKVKDNIFSMFGNSDGFDMQSGSSDDDYVEVKNGPIVSQSTVVKDEKYKDAIRSHLPRALAGEMEGHAIMRVIATMKSHHEAIVIKGIADWGDGDKEASRKWQKFASVAAATYVYYRMGESDALKKYCNEEAAAGATVVSQQPQKTPGSVQPASSISSSRKQDALSPDDSIAVMTATVAITEWDMLATLLGIPRATVKRIKSNNPLNAQLQQEEIIDEWLMTGKASWRSLVAALRDPLVRKGAIADKIEKEHL